MRRFVRSKDGGRPGLYLLASYPKSGNTWVRILLEAWHEDGPVDINDLGRASMMAGRALFEDVLDVEPGLLDRTGLIRARPVLARLLAEQADAVFWHKSHDANLVAPGAEEPPFPPGTLAGLVLIVRDPRDVAPSWAHHTGKDIDTAIALMAGPDTWLARNDRQKQVPQYLSGWSRFYESWLAVDSLPKVVVRYEDMLADPATELARILGLAGLNSDRDRLDRAVAAADFDRLRQQESERGFRETPLLATGPFFRQGRAGGWRESLTEAQARRIEGDHGRVMARFGYH